MWTGFQKPKRLTCETMTERYGHFSAQPFERGFGTTIGNSLRRALLSSIEGTAITAVRIDGVLHEFSSIPGVVEDKFLGVVNLVTMKARIWRDESLGAKFDDVEIPAELLEEAQHYRTLMVEAVSECDDELTNKYLEGQELTEAELLRGIRKATIAMQIFPVICGSSFKNKGVQDMLDAVVNFLPSPLDIPPVKGINPDDGSEVLRPSEDSAPFSGLVFKIMTDPFVGQLCFVRVYSGKLMTGTNGYNAGKRKSERIGRIVKMHANKREEIQEVLAGDICACVGLKTVQTGDTICDQRHPVIHESSDFPAPLR